MSRLSRIFGRGYKTVVDGVGGGGGGGGGGELIQILRSELKHEQSTDQFKRQKRGSLGSFELSWDENRSKDVVLRRKFDSGEEIALSALLEPYYYEEEVTFPFKTLMKVCLKKPELSSVLQFDCEIENGDHISDFSIKRACYLPSLSSLGGSVYKGPIFRDLDPELQASFKEYLIEKGISKDLINYLVLHLHRKEKDQYMHWLVMLESFFSKDQSSHLV